LCGHRSIIFTNGTLEARLAGLSKEKEQGKDRSSIITTEIHPVGAFYPAEPEHQVDISICFLARTAKQMAF
jgi:peptide-methionine (S)-S-oxide reductase